MGIRHRTLMAWELLRALGPMVFIEVSLRTADLPATCRRLGLGWDLESPTPPAAELAALPRGSRAAVRAAQVLVSHWPGGNTCLRQCLLVGHRLRKLQPVLRIGVRRDQDGVFCAHSWLEIGGRTLDPTASRYAALGSAGR